MTGVCYPEGHEQDAQQAGGGAEDEKIWVADGGEPAAKEGDDDVYGADDGVGDADVGGALLGPGELEHDHEAGDEGRAEVNAEEDEDKIVENRHGGQPGDDIARGGGEPAEYEREFVSFAVGEKAKNQIAGGLTDEEGDSVVADGAAGYVPFADGGRCDKGHAHAADGEQAAGDEEAAEVLIAAQDAAEPGPDAEAVFGGAGDLAHRLAGEGEDGPAGEHEDGGEPEEDEEVAGEEQCLQDAAAAEGAERADDAADEHGYAHKAAAAVGGKADCEEVLPSRGDDSGAEVVDGECEEEEGEGPGGRADCEQGCCGQEDKRKTFEEESEIDQPRLFAVRAFDGPCAEELGEEPAAVGDDCEQAEEEGVAGQPADEEGEDGGGRHEALGQEEEGAVDDIDGEVPVVVAPYFGFDVLIGADGGG